MMGEQPEVVEAVSTDVARTEPAAPVVQSTGVEPPEAMLWRHYAQVATTLSHTDFVPEPYRGKKQAIMACLAYGHEIGLGPMQSLQSIDVIQGKPTLKPEAMRAMILAAGHIFTRREATGDRAVFYGKRHDTGEEETVTFTIDDARALGLANKDNWKKQPRAMLSARATGELARSLFSDVIRGVSYTPEELGDETPVAEIEREATALVSGATMPPITNEQTERPRCMACAHDVADHSEIRRGCKYCPCRNTFVESASPSLAPTGEGDAPAEAHADAGNATSEHREAAPPTPPTPVLDAVPQDDVQSDGATGPGQPPAPTRAAEPGPPSEAKFKRLHIAMTENFGRDCDDQRHAIVHLVTAGRTESSRAITADEADLVLRYLALYRMHAITLGGNADDGWATVALTNRGAEFLDELVARA